MITYNNSNVNMTPHIHSNTISHIYSNTNTKLTLLFALNRNRSNPKLYHQEKDDRKTTCYQHISAGISVAILQLNASQNEYAN